MVSRVLCLLCCCLLGVGLRVADTEVVPAVATLEVVPAVATLEVEPSEAEVGSSRMALRSPHVTDGTLCEHVTTASTLWMPLLTGC